MQTKALFLILIILSTFFMACEKENITPSNNVTSEFYSISEFNELEVSGPFNAYVTFSETEQGVQIKTNDNLHAVIQVKQRDGKLSIELEDHTTIENVAPVLDVFVTINAIQTIKAQGNAQIHLQNQWNEDQIEIELVGASSLKGVLNANQLDSKLLGASNLNIQGSVDIFEIDADGASNMEDFGFETNELSVDLNGACDVSITVHNKLDVKAVGGSNVYYKGNGTIQNQNLSGGSWIMKMD